MWTDHKTHISYIKNNCQSMFDPIRVAAFDLDDTLMCRDKKSEITLTDDAIPDKIRELICDRYIIIIFTNQSGMTNTHARTRDTFNMAAWRKKLDLLMEAMLSGVQGEYYLATYVAKGDDLYRKPNLGMWDVMKHDIRRTFALDKLRISKRSFYCGDAAGRTAAGIGTLTRKFHPHTKKDFSDTDYKFAKNIRIDFFTPENLFLGEPKNDNYVISRAHAHSRIDTDKAMAATPSCYNFVPAAEKELIMMHGFPGSGKSTFVRTHILKHHPAYINQDIQKTKSACLKKATEALRAGKLVVIDNTNSNILSRKEYIDLAIKFGYSNIRAIIMDTSEHMSKHLNNVRHVYSGGKIGKINKIVYNIYRSKQIVPSKAEGFTAIETVPFCISAELLQDRKWRKIFLLESDIL